MSALLTVRNLDAGYGQLRVLEDISIEVGQGEVVAIVGANGAGKTTLLSAVAGLVKPRGGSLALAGEEIGGLGANRVVGKGLVLVPEGGRLFPFLSVLDNLELGAYARHARAEAARTLEEALTLFPILAERRHQLAGKLSGGERQMCAIARAMMSRPKLLMLDEPSAGLSPLMVERVFDLIQRLVKERDITVLLVEQNVTEALEIAQRAYVLERGRIVKAGPAGVLRQDPEVRESYMGIS